MVAQRVLAANIARHFRREFVNFEVPKGIYINVCGTDLIRDKDGNYLVL